MLVRLLFFLWALPSAVTSQTLDAPTIARVQQALQVLEYPVPSADGVWRDDTSWAVAQYLYDFGIAGAATLTPVQAEELIAKAEVMQRGPGLVLLADDGLVAGYAVNTDGAGKPVPVQTLYASGRHALAMDLLSRVLPYDYQRSINPTYQIWSEDERRRARRWMETEFVRLDAEDQTAVLFERTLVEIDWFQHADQLGVDETGQAEALLHRLRILMERFPAKSIPDQLRDAVNRRLLSTLVSVIRASDCETTSIFPADTIALSMAVLQRAEDSLSGTSGLMAAARELTECVDATTADRLFAWRRAVASALGDTGLALEVGMEHVRHAYQRGDHDIAKRQLTELFNAGTEADRFRLATETPMSRLGLLEYARPYILAKLDAMRGTEIMSNAAARNAMFFGIDLLLDGFGFEIVDRIFLETNNIWCGPDQCDVLFFYTLMMDTMKDSGDGEASLPFLQPLIDRALTAGNLEAAEAFSANRIEILLALGRFSEAEEQIASFIALSRQGGQDPRIATWQAQLNLADGEGQSAGVVFARQFAAYLDVACVPEPVPVDLPSMDREAVYEDPDFLPEARRLGLADRIATCNANPSRLSTFKRLGCYLWAKDDDLNRLTVEMQAWLLAVQDADQRARGPMLEIDMMACPMGIAEAGRQDLLAQFVGQIPDDRTEDGLVLLKLSARGDEAYARWVTTWSGNGRSGVYDVDFLLMEAATRLGDPLATRLRADALGAFFSSFSGASPDTSEMAFIRVMALDQAAGYAALNLDGIALFFLEAAAPETAASPDPTQVERMLADAESARYALARARLAVKAGDPATALSFVSPLIEAFLDRAQSGKVGSVEDLGPWARRLRAFVELYLTALAMDPALLAKVPPERILAAQQLLLAAEASATSGRLAARLSATDADLVRDYQDALRHWRATMRAATSTPDAPATILAARQKVDALRAELDRVDPAFSASSAISIVNSADLAARSNGHAIVALTSLPQVLYVTTLVDGNLQVRTLPISRARAGQAITSFRASILEEADTATADAKLLVSAVLAGLDGSSNLPKGIVFIVDDPFVSLPFGALPILVGGQATFLGAETAVSISPSMVSLNARKGTAGRLADRPFLGIGDAEFSESAARERLGFVPAQLRETNAELRFLAALLQADLTTDLLLGPAATEDAIRGLSDSGELQRYRTIAFATHGYFDNPGRLVEAGLLLSEPSGGNSQEDGVLSASEIYDLRLDAELIILSACDTGAVALGKRGLSDLAKAFTFAGARALIVTHWEIDTHAATELSKRLATELQKPGDAANAEALQSAVRSLLQDPASSRFHHPKFWASHTVVGL